MIRTYKSRVHDQVPEGGVGVCEEIKDGVAVELHDGFRVNDLVLGVIDVVVLEVRVVGETSLGFQRVDKVSADWVNDAAQEVEGEGKVLVAREATGPEKGMEDNPHGDVAQKLENDNNT